MIAAFEASREDDGVRLDRVVRRLLSTRGIETSTGEARRLVEAGHVRVDGRVADRPSAKTRAGQAIEVNEPSTHVAALRARRERKATLVEDAIVHEDDELVAIDKPAGLATHATRDPRRDHVLAAVSRLLEARGGASQELFAAHRLDAETSGVILLAKSRKAATALGAAFADGRVEKLYEAVAWSRDATLDDELSVQSYLATRRGRTEEVRSGGVLAHTDFVVRARQGELSLVEARPRTGRTHQIRVHLAARGAAILGDAKYGPPAAAREARLYLHARALSLTHPTTNERLHLEAPRPPHFWPPARPRDPSEAGSRFRAFGGRGGGRPTR